MTGPYSVLGTEDRQVLLLILGGYAGALEAVWTSLIDATELGYFHYFVRESQNLHSLLTSEVV